jgi:hypothetical protein
MINRFLSFLVLLSGFTIASAEILFPPGTTGWHRLGDSLSADGDHVAVSTPGNGQVIIMVRHEDGWRTSKIIPVTEHIESVHLSGGHLCARSTEFIRMYARNTGGLDNWGLTAEMATRSQGVALSGPRMLVAHDNRTDEYGYSGETGRWTHLQLVATGPQIPQVLSGDSAILVADNPFVSFTGYPQLFKRGESGSWEPGKAFASVHHTGGRSGIAMQGDRIILGIPARFTTGNTGEVHVLGRNTGGPDAWGEEQIITPEGAAQAFGASISFTGDTIAVGMEGTDQTIHLYRRAGESFDLLARLLPGGSASPGFGRALGLSADRVVAADLWGNTPNNYAGAVFSFSIPQVPSDSILHEDEIFTTSPEATGDRFGESLAMDGDLLAVGTPFADDPSENGGTVYLYQRAPDGSWQQLKTLTPASDSLFSHFGSAVALHNGILAVAASGTREIHLFGRDHGGPGQWGKIVTIPDCFANQLCLDGDVLAAASTWSNLSLFERNQGGNGKWGKVPASGYGSHVTVSGGILISSSSSSMASVLERRPNGWEYASGITTSDPYIQLGACSLSGDTVAISAARSYGQPSGEWVLIFKKDSTSPSGWTEIARIQPPDRQHSIRFGHSIQLMDNMLVVGAPGDITGGVESGSVYVFRGSENQASWSLVRKIRMPGSTAEDAYGSSVATNGDDVAAGAPENSTVWPEGGAVHVDAFSTHLAKWMDMHSLADHDEQEVLLGYAMGVDPRNDPARAIRLVTGENGHHTVFYPRAKDAPGVDFRIEWSDDLSLWKDTGTDPGISRSVDAESPVGWHHRLVIPQTSNGRAFFRARAIRR